MSSLFCFFAVFTGCGIPFRHPGNRQPLTSPTQWGFSKKPLAAGGSIKCQVNNSAKVMGG